MTEEPRRNGLNDPGRLALEYALDCLGHRAKAAVLQQIETQYSLSLYNNKGEISRIQLENVMSVLFDSGAAMFMKRFDEYMMSHPSAPNDKKNRIIAT